MRVLHKRNAAIGHWNYKWFGGHLSLRYLLRPEILVALRTHVTERGMQPSSVVKHLQIFEARAPCKLPGREAQAVDQLAL